MDGNDMTGKFSRMIALGLLLAGATSLTACSRGATRGGLIGGAGGAVIGSATGLGTTEGAVIGGTAGAIIGDKSDCSKKDRRRGRC
ncbi:hypothetical protein SAMN05518668_106117 [Sphingobium sp. YR657]|uniref:YMGG-like Gly-zipper domain-containing protein n=3 Tax=Sphingobium yanoikuyae TaxID=13690 RepID=K9D6P6_SPHYA|nr:hypothetical protein HMPREF9718_02160 [Sphingobium yanoikuyae ATCC 51230]SHM15084.1 hypothetical protein SAMN05518668_106117 [Sphingobium sp. YR657]